MSFCALSWGQVKETLLCLPSQGWLCCDHMTANSKISYCECDSGLS